MPLNGKKLFALSKGYRGRSKNVASIARPRVEKGLQYQYRDRRARKREMRKLWITQLNAASRHQGLPYSRLITGLDHANVAIDRKVLSELARTEPRAFAAVVQLAKKFVPENVAQNVLALNTEGQVVGTLGVRKLEKPKAEFKVPDDVVQQRADFKKRLQATLDSLD